MLEEEPAIIASARKHGVADADILHAFNNPARFEELNEGMVMLVGPARSAQLLEVGFLDTDHGPVIVHAMPARQKYLRRW